MSADPNAVALVPLRPDETDATSSSAASRQENAAVTSGADDWWLGWVAAP